MGSGAQGAHTGMGLGMPGGLTQCGFRGAQGADIVRVQEYQGAHTARIWGYWGHPVTGSDPPPPTTGSSLLDLGREGWLPCPLIVSARRQD